MLILEAAEQAAAPARDLGRVEREVLVFGQAEINGRQLLEPGGAAVFPAAATDAGQPGCLVPHADLPQLNPGAEQRSEIAHQRSEIDPLIGREVDGQLVPVPLPLGIAHLHHEVVGPHSLNHLLPNFFLGSPDLPVGLQVVRGGPAHDRLG
jgi:hypothetical protein